MDHLQCQSVPPTPIPKALGYKNVHTFPLTVIPVTVIPRLQRQFWYFPNHLLIESHCILIFAYSDTLNEGLSNREILI